MLTRSMRFARFLTLGSVAMVTALWMSCAQNTPIEAPVYEVTQLPPAEITPYTLQPRDTISVVFWGNTELDQELTIRPDGMISLPFVDEVRAGGLTPKQLDDELTRRYTGELARPEITVIVRDVPGYRYYIGGEVQQQGAYPLAGNVTLVQAIQEAGGFTTTARRHEVLVIRTKPTGERSAWSVDTRPIISGANPNADFALAAADIIFVPRSKITNINLFVDQYINQVLPNFVRVQLNLFEGTVFSSDSGTTNP